jgi:hypothetical protein
MSMAAILPPGLKGNLVEESSLCGGDAEWLDFSKQKLYTNAFIMCEGKVRMLEVCWPNLQPKFFIDSSGL